MGQGLKRVHHRNLLWVVAAKSLVTGHRSPVCCRSPVVVPWRRNSLVEVCLRNPLVVGLLHLVRVRPLWSSPMLGLAPSIRGRIASLVLSPEDDAQSPSQPVATAMAIAAEEKSRRPRC